MTQSRSGSAFIYVTSLFFVWGFITATNDVLVPAVRSIFTLNYSESMLTQFAFFLSYGIVSLPASTLVARLGASRSILLALGAMVAACLIMPLATVLDSYWVVLLALFVLGSGIALLQVSANPLAASLGRPEHSHLRLTLSQAFNSLGTAIAPYVGSLVVLRGGVFSGGQDAVANRAESLGHINMAYGAAALVLVLLAIALWRVRTAFDAGGQELQVGQVSPFEALKSRWALAGGAAIFLYVGAEVAVGSILINFLVQPQILGASYEEAGRLVALYWSGAMVGRFAGSLLMRRFQAATLLTGVTVMAGLLCLAVTQLTHWPAAVAALAVGLCNSIMFPTIFTLTLERSSAPQASTSGLLCTAIVGGALLPQAMGRVADTAGISLGFLIPACAYAGLVFFAVAARRSKAMLRVAAVSLH